jgi:hypothetical protein
MLADKLLPTLRWPAGVPVTRQMTVQESDLHGSPFGKPQNGEHTLLTLRTSGTSNVPAQLDWRALAIACLFSLAVFALALWSPAIFNDGDTYWHIRAGQWMLAHHTVLNHDVFSRAFLGRPWITQEWLSEVLMATAFQLAGWNGVAMLTGSATAAAVMLLAFFLSRRLDPLPCVVALVLGISCLMPDYLARPHILALPFLTAWMIGLAHASSSQLRPSWLLLPIITVWANLHGSFVFGLALLIPMAIDAAWESDRDRLRILVRWAIFAAGAVGAVLLNPHGVKGLIYPFELMQVRSLAAVGEWQPLDLRQFNPVEFAALATAFVFIWRGIRVRPMRLLLLIALFHQSLAHARYGLILGITAPVLLADALATTMNREHNAENSAIRYAGWVPAIAAVTLLCAVLRVLNPIERAEGPASPAKAVASIPVALAGEAVFNDYAFGGYLIFHGIRPLVDSRADFYGDAWLADYSRVVNGDTEAVDRIFRTYGVRWTLLGPNDPLVGVMDRRPGWHRLFSDSVAVIHVAPDFASPRNSNAP